MSAETIFSGGCQCGAVRYRIRGEILKPSICHCRMCQKAFGSYFAPLGSLKTASLDWTRGEPALYRSSSVVTRGFCAACGTPLSYELDGEDEIAISLGSLDDPAAVEPVIEYGTEGRMPWFDRLAHLKGRETEADMPPAAFARLVSHQHPDHDTPRWPPAHPGRPDTEEDGQ